MLPAPPFSRSIRRSLLFLTASAPLLLLGLAEPSHAANFVTFADTQTFNYCNTSLTSGGSFDGSDLASAVAPTATTLGSCTLGSVTAIADASAFLGSGQLHVYATADGEGSAFAAASMADILSVVPPGGFVDSTFPVTFTMTLGGTLSGNATVGAQLSGTSSIDSPKAQLSLCSGAFVAPGCSSSNQLSVTVQVLTAAPLVGFSELLNATASNCRSYGDCYSTVHDELHGVADFAHTAQIAVQLPPGFTYTSNSGVFLSEVPEPAESALLVLGLALLGGVRASRTVSSEGSADPAP